MAWTFLEKTTEYGTQSKQNTQRRKIVHLLFHHQELSIPALCQFLKLSVPTGTKLVKEFENQGILVEAGKRESSGGRRPVAYRLAPNMGYVVCIELVSHAFKLGIINLQRELVYEYESETFDLNDKNAALDFLKTIVPQIINSQNIPAEKILGVGIGIAGRVNHKKGISYSYLNLDQPLANYLQMEWGFPVFIDNDTRLLAWGENTFGLAQDKKNAICVNLSRGLAVSLISNGQLHNGHSGFAGEFGHIFAADNKRLCICGKKGCLETLVSGLALESAYAAQTGEQLPYKKILNQVERGQPQVIENLHQMGEQLGRALAGLIDLLNPELIVLSGGFVPVFETMRYSIIKGISLYSLPQLASDCEIKVSTLGDNAGIMGAYAMVFEQTLAP
ncbi:ROK family transcriptional regulator [Haliscomenobacter sp.]|uniref:ROK family transcriptional regulator n=1 Tax=Haliscomenobacter sp. TaxID=2717303 RepID=UPI003BA8ECE6